MSPYYENITLVSLDGDLSVVLYLPYGTVHTTSTGGSSSSSTHDHHSNNHHTGSNNHQKNYYYYGSRFDHGSMIGSITTKRRVTKKRRSHGAESILTTTTATEKQGEEERVERHELFGSDMWRLPHNSHWPESGIGLAAEFGVGDDGDLCDMKCGYSAASYGITNGVLGYNPHPHNDENDDNDQFLKIGVGVLLKGTCPACDSTNDYKFNSPYIMAETPVWTVQEQVQMIEDTPVVTILLDHEATTSSQRYGYKIHKEIYLHPNNSSLIVTTQLYNIGKAANPEAAAGDAAFSTVWYSHNFFTCDHQPVGPGYSVDLDIQGDAILQQQQPQPQESPPPGMVVDPSSSITSLLYDEPGTWSWSKPIADYSTIQSYPQSVHVQMNREMEPGRRIKTEFKNDHATRGGFTMRACDTIVESALSWPDQFNVKDDDDNDNRNNSDDHQTNPTIEMYAYNLYMERGTMSPEPQLLFSNVRPGSHVEWTQRITIRPANDEDDNNHHHHHDAMQQGDEMANGPPPMTWFPATSMWLTNRFSGYQTPPPPHQPLPFTQHHRAVSVVVVTIVPLLLSFVLLATSSIRRYRQYQQRRQQYESIA